jgi:DNA topoisomerase-3
MPTESVPSLAGLSNDERNIFELIAKRFLCIWLPDKIEFKTVILTEVEGEWFKTNGNVIQDPGWSVLDDAKARRAAPKKGKGKGKGGAEDDAPEDDESVLPPVTKGMNVLVQRAETKADKTKSPKPYTEAKLLQYMETAGKDLDEDELRGIMKNIGLGTAATRAATIAELVRSKLIERQGKANLRATDKGIDLIRRITVDKLKTPEMTGEWELALAKMQRNEVKREDFIVRIRGFIKQLVDEIKASVPKEFQERAEPKKVGTCPKCKKGDLLLRKSRDAGWYVTCSIEKCKTSYTTDEKGVSPGGVCKYPECKGVVKVTLKGSKICVVCGKWQDEGGGFAPAKVLDKPCPKCGKKLFLKTWEKRFYVVCEGKDVCKVAYNSDEKGNPLGGECKECHEPMAQTRTGKTFCVACGKWGDDSGGSSPVPARGVATRGSSRPAASARRGK